MKPPPARKPRRLLRVATWSLGAAALALAGFGAWVATVAASAPDVAALQRVQAVKPSAIVSADGVVLAKFERAQREPVTLAQVSPAVVQALIATEDRRFWQHRGVDWQRTVAAAWHTAAGDTQGGSTITQQLARNLFPERIGRDRTLSRKIREMATAMRIERHFGKRRILEAYLNTAPFLYNVVGIEMAARTYFDKSAAELDTLEAATLVGMLKGSAYYHPLRHPERAQARRNVVLARMARDGALAETERAALAARPLGVTMARPADPAAAAPHFVAWVRRQVLDWADEQGVDLYADGLTVETTLDSRLQDAATQAVAVQTRALQAVADVEWSRPAVRVVALDDYPKLAAKAQPFAHFWQQNPTLQREVDAGARDAAARAKAERAATRLEAGFVAVDPASGAVRAWVGSRDWNEDQFDHVAQAQRQPGSTFKPFVYAAALEAGLDPWQSVLDAPVEHRLADGSIWKPTDMNGSSGVPLPLREGLVLSKNTITAQVARDVGIARVAAQARALGIASRLDEVPSLALGTSPVTLLEMTGAYAAIAAEGIARAPFALQRIRDRDGGVLAEFGSAPRRALSAETALEIGQMLREAVARGTGTWLRSRFAITADVAGKTGTTQDNTDAWFIAMHPRLVAGAWIGFNDQRVRMRSSHWGQGGHSALLVVGDFFKRGLTDGWIDPEARFARPARPLRPPQELAVEPALDAAVERLTPPVDTPIPALLPAPAPLPPAVPTVVAVAPQAWGDRAAVPVRAGDAPPKSTQEIDRAWAAMGSAWVPAQHRSSPEALVVP